jgi:hypothetical protein
MPARTRGKCARTRRRSEPERGENNGPDKIPEGSPFVSVLEESFTGRPAEYVHGKVAGVDHGPSVCGPLLRVGRERKGRVRLEQLQTKTKCVRKRSRIDDGEQEGQGRTVLRTSRMTLSIAPRFSAPSFTCAITAQLHIPPVSGTPFRPSTPKPMSVPPLRLRPFGAASGSGGPAGILGGRQTSSVAGSRRGDLPSAAWRETRGEEEAASAGRGGWVSVGRAGWCGGAGRDSKAGSTNHGSSVDVAGDDDDELVATVDDRRVRRTRAELAKTVRAACMVVGHREDGRGNATDRRRVRAARSARPDG